MKNTTKLYGRLLTAALMLGSATFAFAQGNTGTATYAANAPWRFGIFGGMQWNLIGTGAQNVEGIGNDEFGVPNTTGHVDIIDGTGLGLYSGLMAEYNPGGFLGGQLRVGLDDRRVEFNNWDVADPTIERRFSARVTYISVEPMLRMNLIQPNFHLTVGPLLSFLASAKYDYIPGRDQSLPTVADQPLSNMKSFTYGVSGGLGYDINMNSKSTSGTRWYLTPFAEASYMMAQRGNTVNTAADRNDTWVTTSIRGGFQLKFGAAPEIPSTVVAVAEDVPVMDLSLRAPNNVTDERRVNELFPLRNYIFFPAGQTALPSKYVHLSPADATNFSERNMTNMPVTGTAASTGDRSARQMSVYYNALNIYADRLRANPSANIQLVGSAGTEADGRTMAQAVKDYMTSTFGIDANRITVRGQVRPPHPSGDASTPKEDMDLVREENVRVEVLSNDNNILKPVTIESVQTEPIDNDLALNVRTSAPVDNWMVTVTGNGFSQTYGPFRGTSQRIDAKPILGANRTGTYTATVTATTASGKTITKSTDFTLTKAEMPPATGQRYSILFEFDDSKTVQTYDQFLRTEVAPKIPAGATVVLHGHTDKVGLDDYNLELSNRRADETKRVLQDELGKLGRTATFDSYGFGETEARAPFTNTAPETRYYNRTVLIEVIPGAGQ